MGTHLSSSLQTGSYRPIFMLYMMACIRGQDRQMLENSMLKIEESLSPDSRVRVEEITECLRLLIIECDGLIKKLYDERSCADDRLDFIYSVNYMIRICIKSLLSQDVDNKVVQQAYVLSGLLKLLDDSVNIEDWLTNPVVQEYKQTLELIE